jgi:uncharacterized protein YutE (UPF0331/DUF86 family)
MIDLDLVNRKLVLILGDLQRLAPLAEKEREDFLSAYENELIAERLLERIIGRLIDVNYHLITESGAPPPSDYYESFLRLAPLKIVPADFATRLAACAGLRNRIAHEYDEIDPTLVHDAIRSTAKDIPEYLRLVRAFVERQS